MKYIFYTFFCFFYLSLHSQEIRKDQQSVKEMFDAADSLDKKDKAKEIEDRNKLDKKTERDWYEGSGFSPIIGVGDDILIGLKFSLDYFYIDFKSNFGLWGTDMPSNYDNDFADLDFILYDLNGTLVDSNLDESDSVYVINVGYILPLIKTKNYIFSVSMGPGLALLNQIKYDRYTSVINGTPREKIGGAYLYSTSKINNTILNLNIGFEIANSSGFGLVCGFDSYNNSPFFGINLTH